MKLPIARLRRFAPVGVQLVRDAYWYRGHGEPEVRLIPSLLPRGGVAVDVGANDGLWSYWLARAAGRRGRVIAIEPLVEHADRIRRASAQLRLRVEVCELAVGDAPGDAVLTTPVASWGPVASWSTLDAHFPASQPVLERQVTVTTLDDLLATVPRIDLVKIDVEGHEAAVLRGARAVLGRHRPVLVVEIEQRHSPRPVAETYALLQELGYRLSFLEVDGGERPIEDLDPAVHLLPDGPRYVNNIIARPR